MKRITLLVIMLSLSIFLLANPEIQTAKRPLVPTFGLGAGYLYQLSVSLLNNDTYYCLRHYGSKDVVFSDSKADITETALLFGRAFNFDTKRKSYLTLALGLSINKKESTCGENNCCGNKETIGFPFDLNYTRGISDLFGCGINVTANVLSSHPVAGVFLNIYLGDFTNSNNSPLKSVANETSNNPFSFDFNILNYFFSTASSYKGSLGWENDNFELIIPFHCQNTESNYFLDEYDTMTNFALKARKHLGNPGWFADLGLEILNVHHIDSFTNHVSYSQTICNAGISLGLKVYLSDNFYLRNQLNIHVPIAGDELDLDVDDNILISQYHYTDFDFLVIGYSF